MYPHSGHIVTDAGQENSGCLSVGLTLSQVRALLDGWTDHPIRGAGMPGKGAYFSLWDFVPPNGSNPIRLTFEDDRLIFWGEPSSYR